MESSTIKITPFWRLGCLTVATFGGLRNAVCNLVVGNLLLIWGRSPVVIHKTKSLVLIRGTTRPSPRIVQLLNPLGRGILPST